MLHGHSILHTPWKNLMTFSAGVGFAAAWVLGFFVGGGFFCLFLLVPHSLSYQRKQHTSQHY